tara:strand:+ start:114 stop:353 length:240 start_codon:yes stop_codon:yes gene_type:complete
MEAHINKISTLEAERNGLMQELRQIAELKLLGIVRHDIVKQRKVTRYKFGRNIPTGQADIIMRDGAHHVVPDNLLMWNR